VGGRQGGGERRRYVLFSAGDMGLSLLLATSPLCRASRRHVRSLSGAKGWLAGARCGALHLLRCRRYFRALAHSRTAQRRARADALRAGGMARRLPLRNGGRAKSSGRAAGRGWYRAFAAKGDARWQMLSCRLLFFFEDEETRETLLLRKDVPLPLHFPIIGECAENSPLVLFATFSAFM